MVWATQGTVSEEDTAAMQPIHAATAAINFKLPYSISSLFGLRRTIQLAIARSEYVPTALMTDSARPEKPPTAALMPMLIGHHVVRQNHGDCGQNGELRYEITAKAIDGADKLDR